MANTLEPVTTKFSDLNAYHQFVQTRAAATLTTASLAIAVSGVVAGLLPAPDPLPRATYLLFLIGGSLVAAAVNSFRALLSSYDFQTSLLERLGSPGLSRGVDSVDANLRDAFIDEFIRKLADLRRAALFLLLSFSLSVVYAILTLRGYLFGGDPAAILIASEFATQRPYLKPGITGAYFIISIAVGLCCSWVISSFFNGYLSRSEPRLPMRLAFLIGFVVTGVLSAIGTAIGISYLISLFH